MRVRYSITHQKSLDYSSGFREAPLGPTQQKIQQKSILKYKERPAGNISFGGSVNSGANQLTKEALKSLKNLLKAKSLVSLNLAKIPTGRMGMKLPPIPKWIIKLTKSENFQSICEFTEKHPQIFGSFLTFGLTSILKPVAILHMPGADDRDKEQAVAKTIVTTILGAILAVIIFSPLSHAVKKIIDNPKIYLGKESRTAQRLSIKTRNNKKYIETYEEFWKQSFEIFLTPFRTAVVIGMMPSLSKILFEGRDKKREAAKLKEMNGLISGWIKRAGKNPVFNVALAGGGK